MLEVGLPHARTPSRIRTSLFQHTPAVACFRNTLVAGNEVGEECHRSGWKSLQSVCMKLFHIGHRIDVLLLRNRYVALFLL
jgi:hypothetical protein